MAVFKGVCAGIHPTIVNEKTYESHPEIRMRTEDVALSAVLNDREIDEITSFRSLLKLFINKFSTFLGILAPHFQTGKTKRSD